jgi:hypothetical protein
LRFVKILSKGRIQFVYFKIQLPIENPVLNGLRFVRAKYVGAARCSSKRIPVSASSFSNRPLSGYRNFRSKIHSRLEDARHFSTGFLPDRLIGAGKPVQFFNFIAQFFPAFY